ncbi:MAG TPA: hypothetical protein VGS58_12440 [Candidatus Sulfopaludibacter sp.]|nr:hypothetical protein [Candidatus Sulfopaludibacter sp.]
MRNLLPVNGTLAAMGIALLAWAAPASAQTVLRFDVPFTFAAGAHVLPPGEYRMSVDTDHMMLRIDPVADTTVTIVRFSVGGDSRSAAKVNDGMLRFQRYGARYFLIGVWKPGALDGNNLTPPKHLVEAAKVEPPRDIVSLGSSLQVTAGTQ